MAPSALPEFLATTGLSDPRPGPLAVMCSRWRLPRAAAPLPGRVSQVPRLICPCALPPLTPGSPAVAVTHCFTADVRLHPNRADCPLPWRNEAETGLLALRLAGSPFRASPNGLLRSTPDRLHVEWAIYTVSSFHLTRSARLGLAHPMNADQRGYFDALTERVLGAVFEVSRRRSTSVRCSTNSSPHRTDRAVSRLFASLGPESVSARQFPETQGRVEANRPRVSDSRVV